MSPDVLVQLPLPAAVGLSGLALAGGAALACLSAPLSCNWPARGQALLRRLNAVKLYRRPTAIRTRAGTGLLAALMAGGALTAYAADPASPQRAPAAAAIAPHILPSVKSASTESAPTLAGEVQAPAWILASIGPGQATPLMEAAPAVIPAAPLPAATPAPMQADLDEVEVKLTKAETDQAERVIIDKCTRCHDVTPITALHQGKAQWRALLADMTRVTNLSRYDPVLTDAETDLVLRYLTQNLGPPASAGPQTKG